MASLFFNCPTTHQQAPTGIETDVQSLRAAWKATLNVKCPHCGEVHEISVRETYINGLKRPISLGHLGPRYTATLVKQSHTWPARNGRSRSAHQSMAAQ